MTPSECARALRRAAHIQPSSRCLARAVAGECLLRRDGYPARLRLGINVGEPRQLRAHAWLECDGVIVIGGEEAVHYAPLPLAP